jgi:hypothetical protein
MERAEFRKKLADLDEKIAAQANVAEDAQLDLEVLWKKREGFARRYCPHAATFTRSVMGRDTETRCKDCNVEV